MILLSTGTNIPGLSEKKCDTSKKFEQIADSALEKYGVNIAFHLDTNILPFNLQEAPANGYIEPTQLSTACRAAKIFLKELEKYPSKLINKELTSIFIVKRLTFYGVDYGGTSIDNSLYLTTGTKKEGYSDLYLAELFHHELSSIFLRNYNFPEQEWSKIHLNGFRYTDSNETLLNTISEGNKLTTSNEIYKAGFLLEYGKSNFENDVNTYAETLMTRPQKIKLLAEKYPTINKKYKILSTFYRGMGIPTE